MYYTVTLWCHDCTGEDYMGCFDGGYETIRDDPDNEASIADLGRAFDIGWRKISDCAPWDFWVEEYTDDGRLIQKLEPKEDVRPY